MGLRDPLNTMRHRPLRVMTEGLMGVRTPPRGKSRLYGNLFDEHCSIKSLDVNLLAAPVDLLGFKMVEHVILLVFRDYNYKSFVHE